MGNLGLADWIIVGFSGHRNLEDPKTVSAGICASLDRVAAIHSPVAAVSSSARGADTLFLEEVARRDIPFFLLLPFHRMRFRQDFVPADWQRVEVLVDRALNVEELGDTETAEEAYLETGVRVVDRSDLMVVVWDGNPAQGMGGTADVVDYTRDIGKPLIIIDPFTGHLAQERLEQLDGQGVVADWNGRPRQAVEGQFELLDQEAVRHQPRAVRSFHFIIMLHLLAAVVAVLAFVLPGLGIKSSMIILEVIFLVAAVSLIHRQQRMHDTWVHSRIGAELCRSFLAMWHMRGRTRPLSPVGGPPLQRLYRSLCMAWYLDRPDTQELGEARDRYLQERVQDQIGYFKRNLEKARPQLQWHKRIATTCTISAIAFALAALVFSLIHTNAAVPSLKATAVLLPLLSAGVLSRVISQDYARRAVRYAEMVSLLENAARRLQTTRTWNSLTRIAVETEEELLHEIVEWHSLKRFASQPH